MTGKFRSSVLLSAGLLIGPHLWAQVTYVYSGSPFTSCTPSGAAIQSESCGGETGFTGISASITYNSAIPANHTSNSGFHGGNQTVDLPTYWVFSDGVDQWTPANSNIYAALVDTDSSGNITGWTFALFSNPNFSLPSMVTQYPYGQDQQGVSLGCDYSYQAISALGEAGVIGCYYAVVPSWVQVGGQSGGTLQISTTSLQSALSGAGYDATLTATGGSGTGYVWSSAGPLPAGFALSSSGVLSSSGNPAASGNLYEFTVAVADSAGNTATQLLVLVVNSSLQITTTRLPSATGGYSYSATLAASGGSGSGYEWSLVSSALPAGFTLNSSGVISSTGNPAAAVGFTYGFQVQVVDSAGNSATLALTLQVVAAVQITTTSLPDAWAGQAYTAVLTAVGGVSGASYSWALLSGTLPAGFTLSSSGVLSAGTPVPGTPANYQFAVQATDNAGDASASQSLTLVVVPTYTTYTYAGNPFNVATCEAQFNSIVPNTVTCAGGSLGGSLTFQGLPINYSGQYDQFSAFSFAGMGIATDASASVQGSVEFSNGSITGWSISAGVTNSYQFSTANGGDSITYDLTSPITVGESVSTPGSWVRAAPPPEPFITTSSLPSTTSGVPYSVTLAATGGSGPSYLWSIESGPLPQGFALSPGGLLASNGVYAAPASYTFTVGVWDSTGAAGTPVALTLVIVPPLAITTSSLPSASSGQAYPQVTLTAAGGSGAGYQWSVPPNTLPSGFSLSQGGVLSSNGSVVAPSSYSIPFVVEDSAGDLTTRTLTLQVLAVACEMNVFSRTVYGGKGMYAEASSPSGRSLLNAATACGFINFDWVWLLWNDV